MINGGRWRLGGASLACAALLLGACSDTTASNDFSGEFTKITKTFGERTQAITEGSAQVADVIDVYRGILRSTQRAHSQYQALEPPEGLQKTYRDFVDVLDQQAQALDRLVAAAEAGDQAALTAVTRELTDLMVRWNELRSQLEKEMSS